MDSKQLAQYMITRPLLLKTEQDILLSDSFIQYGFIQSALIQAIFLSQRKLVSSNVKICTVVGFPLGANLSVKARLKPSYQSRGG